MSRMSRIYRYSPVNGLIVDWSYNGKTFDMCGMPQGDCSEDPDTPEEVYCRPLPIEEAIDTYDWARWLPEVMLGINDPNEEIAANVIREVAIEFARDTRVLRRYVYLPLTSGESTYPLFPYAGERIVGVIRAELLSGEVCPCKGNQGFISGRWFRYQPAKVEIEFPDPVDCDDVMRVEVWSTPTEDACAQDVALYDMYRADIAREARRRYVMAYHFNEAGLIRSLNSAQDFELAKVRAKVSVAQTPSQRLGTKSSSLFSGGGQRRGVGYHVKYKGW